jgi:hypothetical protein
MSVAIEIKGLNDVRSMLAALGGEMEAVNKYAQNQMAYELWVAEKEQMRTDIDRPNPFSIGALRYKRYGDPGGAGAPAVVGAAVHFAIPFGGSPGLEADEYLGVQQLSGQTAGPRASEVRLRQLGYLPDGYVWVPDPAVSLDRYGNVKGSVVQSMLAELAKGTSGQNFFVMGWPGRPRGIFARVGDNWLPFLWFVSRRDYRAIFDFYGRADTEIESRFESIWGEQVNRALQRL